MSFCRLSVSFCVSLVFCRCVSCRSITTPDNILDFHRPDRLFFCDIDGSFAVRQDRCGGSRCFGGFGVCRIYRRLLADLPSDQYDAGDRCLFERGHQRRHNGLYQLADGTDSHSFARRRPYQNPQRQVPVSGRAEAVAAKVEDDNVLHVYDITIFYADGREYEPLENQPINVTFKSEKIALAHEKSAR